MFHLAAWLESIDPGGNLTTITAVFDQALTTQGDDVRVPSALPNIIGQLALGNDASLARAQIQSPSLRAMANLDIEPIVAALVLGSPPEILFHPMNPIPVVVNESLNLAFDSDPAAAQVHQGFVWLSDGPQQPVNGNIFSVRAVSAIALVSGAWEAGALAFAQTLPAGEYDVVGMRARGTNLVAARLNFVGGTVRPGVPAVNAIADEDVSWLRHGRSGVFGRFEQTQPPTVEAFGVTDTAQVYIIDLMKIR